MIQERHPVVAGNLALSLAAGGQCAPSVRAAAEAAEALRADGFQPPAWDELLRLDPRSQGRDAAGMVLDAGLLADLDPASRALLLSQAGDHAGCFFTVLPTAPEFNVPGPHFRVAALRLPSASGCAPVGARWMPWGTTVRLARVLAC